MDIAQRQQQAFAEVSALNKELLEIAQDAGASGDHLTGTNRLNRWRDRTNRKISELINQEQGEAILNVTISKYFFDSPTQFLIKNCEAHSAVLNGLLHEIAKHPESLFRDPIEEQQMPTTSPATVNQSKKVFLIHGHDRLNLRELQLHLTQKLMLEVVVLGDTEPENTTVIEEFENAAEEAGFAFAFFSPDDLVQKDKKESYYQGRPNVLFELGWFWGKLGRKKVCILHKKGTTLPSDLNGILYVHYEDNIMHAAHKIEARLENAGIIPPRPKPDASK